VRYESDKNGVVLLCWPLYSVVLKCLSQNFKLCIGLLKTIYTPSTEMDRPPADCGQENLIFEGWLMVWGEKTFSSLPS